MTTEPAAKHQEEAREIVRAWLLTSNPHHLIDHKDNLVDRFTASLSSHNTQIREVLEGLRTQHHGNPRSGCWCDNFYGHSDACLAARELWERVQDIDTK